VSPTFPLRCSTCGFACAVIRAAGLAGKIIFDHGEKCPRCGGRMELASAPTKNSMPDGKQNEKD
jgi:hypothetical protein